MMRTIRYLMTLALLLPMLACNSGATPPVIVVGHIADNKRSDQAGYHAECGIRLALHEQTKSGSLSDTLGNKKIQVNHTITDGEIGAFESQAVRLVSVNRAVAIFGGTSPREVSALDHVKAPILTFQGQPVVGASSNIFYLGLSAVRQGETLGKTLAENEKVRQVVFIQDERRVDGAALIDAFQKAMGELRKDAKAAAPNFLTIQYGKDPTLRDAIQPWHDIIERTLTPSPQAIVFVGAVNDFNDWHREALKERYIGDISLVYAGSDGDHRLLTQGNGKGNSILYATAFHADPASEKISTFRAACKDKFQFEADVHAALAHDGMRLLVDAMKRTPTQVTPEKVHEALLKTKDFDGLNGPLTITAERQVLRPSFVMRWESGAPTLIKSFSAPKEAKKD